MKFAVASRLFPRRFFILLLLGAWFVPLLASPSSSTALLDLSVENSFLDPASPAVAFNGLRHYASVSGLTPISVTASDDVGVSRVELYFEGQLLSAVNVIPNLPTVVVPFTWNAAGASNGKHMLHAKAFDAAGNSTTKSIIVVCRNLGGPTPTPTLTPTPTPTPAPTATPTPPAGNNITLNPATVYQTMSGWEITSQAGQNNSPAWNNYKSALLDQAVSDLGINRIRAEVVSGVENPTDYFAQWRAGQITESQYNTKRYEIINDNADPATANTNGFKWSSLDAVFDNLVIPMRQRLQARGESLWVSICYVDFGASGFEHKNNPPEYAEFVLAAYQHVQAKYGFVPDSWEVILEPDTSTAAWSAIQVAQAIKAAGDRLVVAGYTPNFVAASTTNTANATIYIDQIAQTAGAMQFVSEFAYHRYCCASAPILQNIANRAIQYNKRAGMLEWIGADYNTLHEDIKEGRNSSWQQFTLAGPLSWGPDNGSRYYLIDDSNVNNPLIIMGSRTKLLRQYFKYVRSGARRIQAQTGNPSFDPLAFINTNGKFVVVVKAAGGGSFNINGLPAGTYGLKYSTSAQYNIDLPDMTVSAGQPLGTNIPAAGVITIYAR
jgi:hypothetical protein